MIHYISGILFQPVVMRKIANYKKHTKKRNKQYKKYKKLQGAVNNECKFFPEKYILILLETFISFILIMNSDFW